MRSGLFRALAIPAAAALALGLAGPPSLATTATSWSISPGGAVTGKSSNLKLANRDSSLTCSSSTLGATFKSGRSSGQGIGSISAGKATCSGPLGLSFSLKFLDLPWTINFQSQSGGVIHGTIGHMELSVTGSGCSAVVDGTSGGASDGTVNFTYTVSSGVLKILATGGNLHYYDVSGCFGLINNGDSVGLSGSYPLNPRQVIIQG